MIGLLVIAFMLGRIVERWRSGGMDVEEVAYEAGYDEGLEEAGRKAAWAYWRGVQEAK